MLHTVSRAICFFILRVFFCIKAYGRNNIPKKGGFILASNHVSYLDPVAVGVLCKRKLNYMARHDLFNNRFFSWWLHRVDTFPVKRDTADLSALKEAMKRVKSGGALLLFPEGRRTQGALAKPEAGVGFLAAKLNVPVIPVFVKGTEKIFPKGAKFMRLGRISVTFGKQIHIERGVPYQNVANLIMENIRHLAW